jgi:hypothetical protein
MTEPKVELKKISFSERMSDETNCFVADLYIDGKKVGYVNNEGHGGCTNYHANTSCAGGFTRANIKLIAEAEKYCKTLPHNEFGEQSLEDVINDLLEAHLKAKDLAKIEKKMQKKYSVAICYGKKIANGYDFATTFWKGRTLAQIPLPYLQKAYDEVKANKMEKGDVILNDNLELLGVKL